MAGTKTGAKHGLGTTAGTKPKVVLSNFKLKPPAVARDRSQLKKLSHQPKAQRQKAKGVTATKSFANVMLKLVFWMREILKQLQATLTNVLLSNPCPPPSCSAARWYQFKIEMIACVDEKSVVLYKAAISTVRKVYPGARLVVVEKGQPVQAQDKGLNPGYTLAAGPGRGGEIR